MKKHVYAYATDDCKQVLMSIFIFIYVNLFYDVLASIDTHFVYSVVSQNSGKHRKHPWTPGRYHEVSESWVPYWKLDGESWESSDGILALWGRWFWWFVFGKFYMFCFGKCHYFRLWLMIPGAVIYHISIYDVILEYIRHNSSKNLPFLWLIL